MWSRTEGLSDTQLKSFSEEDLCLVRSAQTPYGPILLGKIKIPEIQGKPGYIHVRYATYSVTELHAKMVHTESMILLAM